MEPTSSTDDFCRPMLKDPIPESLIDRRYPHENIVPRVIIRHPAYSDHNELLSFNAWDYGRSGVHLGTVLLACRLVACNEFNGFLTKDQNGSEQITGPDDSLLHTGVYFFHVREQDPAYKYPIYSSFKDWTYPHGKLPSSWVGSWTTTIAPGFSAGVSDSTTSALVISRDGMCCVSSCVDSLERAYLCPQSERDWFLLNSMQLYNSNNSLSPRYFLNDKVNSISLRVDIHRKIDAGGFVIVRKNGKTDQ